MIGTDESVARDAVRGPRPPQAVRRPLPASTRRLLRSGRAACPRAAPRTWASPPDDLAELGGAGLLYAVERALAGERVDVRRLHGAGRQSPAPRAAGGRPTGTRAARRSRRATRRAPSPRFEKAAAAVPEGRIFTPLGRPRPDRPQAVSRRRTSGCSPSRTGGAIRATRWLRPTSASTAATSTARSSGCATRPRGCRPRADRRRDPSRRGPWWPSSTTTCSSGRPTTTTARDYALRMAERARRRPAAGAWAERAGDASFYRQDLAEARELYTQRHRGRKGQRRPCVGLYLRLADIAFLDGRPGDRARAARALLWRARRVSAAPRASRLCAPCAARPPAHGARPPRTPTRRTSRPRRARGIPARSPRCRGASPASPRPTAPTSTAPTRASCARPRPSSSS